MTRHVSFDVIGVPKPQGSARAFVIAGKARVTTLAKDNGWRDSVARAARLVTAEPFTGPVGVNVTFRMPRPKSRPKSHHGWHSTAPDIDKLLRSVLDGLTAGGLWWDDGQVADVTARAIETVGWTGARITVHELEPRNDD